MSPGSTDAPAPVLRPRTALLLGSGAALVLGAFAFRTPVALFAAVPLLLVPLIAAAQRPSRIAEADLRWEAGGLGPQVDVSGVLTGPFGGAAANVEVIPPEFPGAISRGPPKIVRGPAEIRFDLGWTLDEPTITVLGPPRVVWRDPLGLWEAPVGGARPELAVERFPPEVHRLGSVRLDRTLQLPGESRSRRIGPTGEFFGIREAQPGEPPRQINWRASARAGRLLANDFQTDRTGDMLLLLDLRPTALGPVADQRLLGIARAGIYGIADALLRGKVRVGFASFGEFVSAVPLASGRAHRVRVQHAVLESRRADVAGPPERLTHGLRRFYRPGLTTLLVSFWTGEREYHLLPYLRRAGFPAVLVSPSPLPLGLVPGEVVSDEERVVRRLERADRRAHLAPLWEHGPVVDWTDYWSLEGLVRLLRQPPRRRGS